MLHDPARVVLQAARRAARASDVPLLLAVSGGLDSMALLVAMARVARGRIAAVATLDHGTGPAATAAAAFVARRATALGIPVVTGRLTPAAARPADGWEAAWRRERHDFLRQAAEGCGACVVTAHTEDDQVETVLMRVLRGAGARGLAGMRAPSVVVRPWLGVRRHQLHAFMAGEGEDWVEDPGNATTEHLRNRVRLDLLPALRAADAGIDAALLETGRRAAAWRTRMDELAGQLLASADQPAGAVRVAMAELAGYDRDSLAVVWGSLAGRVGLALDRRGTHRLASFIIEGAGRGAIPLSGGWCLEAQSGTYLLYRPAGSAAAPATLPRSGSVEWGGFRFQVSSGAAAVGERSSWSAALPEGAGATVRSWCAGDRLAPAGGQPRRRVARYLSDAGVHGSDRARWPVVVAEGPTGHEVIWIPGVRRSDAATERSGGPVRHYVCERIAP